MKANSNILDQLPNLSDAQLREVQARATALMRKPESQDDGERFLFSIMNDSLAEFGCPRVPWVVFTKSRAFPKFRGAVPGLISYVNENFRTKTQTERAKVVGVLVKVLCRAMISQKIPVTFQSVAERLGSAHAAVELAFPGYRESGLLRWVVDRYNRVA